MQKKLLVVCTGNTCRSPLAAVCLRELLGAPWEVTSAGISAPEGGGASRGSQAAAAAAGYDLTGHRARRLSAPMLADAGLVLVMTADHRSFLEQAFPRQAGKIYTLKGYLGLEGDVPDPYGGDQAEYDRAAREIWQLCTLAAQKLREG
jgi:protein-tyrosine-phosphatase